MNLDFIEMQAEKKTRQEASVKLVDGCNLSVNLDQRNMASALPFTQMFLTYALCETSLEGP
jgi:hypothetical protein